MSQRRTTFKTFHRARELRGNLTIAEKKLWSYLRAHQLSGIGFRRQHPIGAYIVDFCAPRRKIIVELDGSQHAEKKGYDETRTAFLHKRGFRVLRFWNSEVLSNIEWVLEQIMFSMNDSVPNEEFEENDW